MVSYLYRVDASGHGKTEDSSEDAGGRSSSIAWDVVAHVTLLSPALSDGTLPGTWSEYGCDDVLATN